MAHEIIASINETRRIEALSPLAKLREVYPKTFYAGLLGLAAGFGFVVLRVSGSKH